MRPLESSFTDSLKDHPIPITTPSACPSAAFGFSGTPMSNAACISSNLTYPVTSMATTIKGNLVSAHMNDVGHANTSGKSAGLRSLLTQSVPSGFFAGKLHALLECAAFVNSTVEGGVAAQPRFSAANR